MKKNVCSLVPAFICLLYVSCQDLVEIDLSKKTINILAPADNSVSPNSSQTFWWKEVKGASSYNLQIVKPGFSSIQQLKLDTTISTTKFSCSLLPGAYQWRIRALNGSSATDYSVYNLTIDSTLNLGNQWVLLSTPAAEYASKNYTHSFSWQTLANADSYLFQILVSGLPVYNQTLTTTSTSYTFSSEGTYQWRILAQNANSVSSPVNATRTIIIDVTAPSPPVLVTPAANDTTANPVNLSWTRDATATEDSVYIYADSNMTVLISSMLTTSQNFSFSGAAGQDYFWKVSSVDDVGNWSVYSTKRKFIIAP